MRGRCRGADDAIADQFRDVDGMWKPLSAPEQSAAPQPVNPPSVNEPRVPQKSGIPQFSNQPTFNETTGARERYDYPTATWRETLPPQTEESAGSNLASPSLGDAPAMLGPGTVYDDQGNIVGIPEILSPPNFPMTEYEMPPSMQNVFDGLDGQPVPGPIPREYDPRPGESFIVSPNGELQTFGPLSATIEPLVEPLDPSINYYVNAPPGTSDFQKSVSNAVTNIYNTVARWFGLTPRPLYE